MTPRPLRLGVDVPASLNLVGALTKYLSLAALFPAAVAIGYSERFWPYLAAGAIAAAVGWALEFVTRGKERVGIREGFLVVSLTWIVAAGFGALPYLFSGVEPLSSPINAYFEAMSGFTTTGRKRRCRAGGAAALVAHVAPVHAVARRHGHHRPRTGRAASASGRRQAALRVGAARA